MLKTRLDFHPHNTCFIDRSNLPLRMIFFTPKPIHNRLKQTIALASFALPILLMGCAERRSLYSPPSIPVSYPAIGVVSEAYPGDPMLTQGTQREYVALENSDPFPVESFVLPPGKYLKEGENNAAEFFSWDEVSRPTNGGIVSDGQTLKTVALIKDSSSLCVQTFSARTYCVERHSLTRTKAAVLDRDRFQKTLLYSGKVGKKINVSYREFSDSYARAAFTNTAEYDLAESRVIGYKGAQLEILEATNQSIKYRVLRNFNDARQ
jgi:hypothetical protein